MQPSDLEVYFLQLVNATRSAADVAPLTFNGELVDAAGGHSDWMVAQDIFSHTGAGGSAPGDRIANAGYGANAWGENVAYIAGPGADVLDRVDVETLHANLMNSSGHRANILSANFEEVGIGLAQGDYNGMPAVFVTQDFGAPNAAQAAEWDPISGTATSAATATVAAPAVRPAVALTAGSGAHTLMLKLAQDAWAGDAQYTVNVDGTGVGSVFTASALRSAGQEDTLTLKGDWAAGPHKVEVTFLNDAWGGTAATDRNLYFNALSYDGVDQAVGNALYSNGTASADFGSSAAPASPIGTGTVTLHLSEDAWLGHAQYTVSLDGVQVGEVRTAAASHAARAQEDVLLTGLTSGQHTVGVTFLNDAWGGTATTDRNLYVEGISVDGHGVPGATASLLQEGTATFNLDVWA